MDEAAQAPKYNILLIVTDQERSWHCLPKEFQDRFETAVPARAKLRREAVSFRNFFINSAPCTPSRAVLYTGQHFQHTGVYANEIDLSPSPSQNLTIGHMLRERGYRTCYKGKWHLTSELSVRHFDEDASYEPGTNYGAHDAQRRRDGKPHYCGNDRTSALEQYGFSEWNTMGDFWGAWNEGHFQDPVTAAEAADFIEARGREVLSKKDADSSEGQNTAVRPWFLAVNFLNPHDIMFFDAGGAQKDSRDVDQFNGKVPFMPAPDTPVFQGKWNACPRALGSHTKYENRAAQSMKANETSDALDGAQETSKAKKSETDDTAGGEFSQDDGAAFGLPLSARFHKRDTDSIFGEMKSMAEFKRNLDFYLNCIVESDKHIMRVLEALEKSGLESSTIVIFTSDHGEMAGAHSLRQKGNLLYKENVTVPFLLRHPLLRREVETPSSSTTHFGRPAAAGTETLALGSLLDVCPTILALAGVSKAEIRKIRPRLNGFDLSEKLDLVSKLGSHGTRVCRQEKGRDARGVLFQYGKGIGPLSRTLRSQCLLTPRFRYGRYFDPNELTMPTTFDELFGPHSRNEIVMFDAVVDPDEEVNLAAPKYRKRPAIRTLLLQLNAQLNRLIARETEAPRGHADITLPWSAHYDETEPGIQKPGDTLAKVHGSLSEYRLHTACRCGDEKQVRKLLRAGFDPRAPYRQPVFPLAVTKPWSVEDDVEDANASGVVWGTPKKQKSTAENNACAGVGKDGNADADARGSAPAPTSTMSPLRLAFERRESCDVKAMGQLQTVPTTDRLRPKR